MKTRSTLAAFLFFATVSLAQTTTGSWTTTVPEDAGALEVTAMPPFGNEGAMNCNRNVIPVKFSPSAEQEDLLLTSDLSDADTLNDASSITFDPEDATLTVSDLTNLTAIYDVVEGDCGGGSLRWSIDTTAGNVFVYYGAAPSFTDCSGAEGQSGINLLSLDDARVDSSQVYAGTQSNTWDAFLAANPDLVVESVSLVADGAWSQPDQVQSFAIESATVNDNTFTGEEAECDLADAEIRLLDADGDEVEAKSVNGAGTMFSEDDCQYHYNLVNPGPGTWTVEITVEGEVIGSETFTISCSNGRARGARR